MFGALKSLFARGSSPDAIDKGKIIPLIKAVVGDAEGSVMKLPPDQVPILRPLVGELLVAYVRDEENNFVFLNRSDLGALGMSEVELHNLALENLPRRMPTIQVHGAYPEFMITCGGNLEATALLRDDLWDQLAAQLKGTPLAASPARDLLFVTDSASEGWREFFRRLIARDLPDKTHILSRQIMERRNGAWHLYPPAS
jgi:uncharacterized protein YtpQ (UPF0354 family)